MSNDDQASALVAALAPLLSKALLPELQKQVEAQIKGVVAKNNELLDKLHNMQKDVEIAGMANDDVVGQAQRLLNATQKPNGLTEFRKGEPVRISRADALDVTSYRKAKALATAQGVALEIAADE